LQGYSINKFIRRSIENSIKFTHGRLRGEIYNYSSQIWKGKVNMAVKKIGLLLLTVLLTFTATAISCQKKVEFPDKTDFELSYEVSNKNPKLNDEITVYAKLKNKTNNKYILAHGFNLIKIFLKDFDDESTSFTEFSILKNTNIQPNSYAEEKGEIKITKKGRFKLEVIAFFDIEIDGQKKDYLLKAKELNFNVED
jgi:hypothetical protein